MRKIVWQAADDVLSGMSPYYSFAESHGACVAGTLARAPVGSEVVIQSFIFNLYENDDPFVKSSIMTYVVFK